jgi:UDP-N-acetylmuramoyl-L-alanyl-D-glutamate--2,6-diaminopimelate ligase
MMFFVAIRGSVSNGHDFIDTILNLETKTIVCDVYPENLEKITYVKVADTNEALAWRLIIRKSISKT